MNRYLFTFFCCLCLGKLYAQGPAFRWAGQVGGTAPASLATGYGVAVDIHGDSYSVGSFSNTVDFDPGPAVYNKTAGATGSSYLLKTDTGGHFLWAKEIRGSSLIYTVAVGPDQNVVVSGQFGASVSIDTGGGIYTLNGMSGQNFFILKFDPGGKLLWAKVPQGAADEVSWAITTDRSGNIFYCGYFKGTVDFDPGSGISSLTATGIDIFVCKLNAAGNLQWARQCSGASAAATGNAHGLVTDNSGNVYVTGNYSEATDFDPGPGSFILTPEGGTDIFVQKLDAAGNLKWVKSMGGMNADAGSGISIDNSGNLFVTGSFNSTADFDPGPGTYNLTATPGTSVLTDIFILRMDTSGKFIWARAMGGDQADNGTSIIADLDGHVYFCGSFSGTADFDPGAGTFSLTAPGTGFSDGFICELDTAGKFAWAAAISGTENQAATFMTTNGLGLIYTTGIFRQTVDFDPSTGVKNLTSAGALDMFLQQLGTCNLKAIVEQAGPVIRSKETALSYQWVTCPGYAPIAGARGQAYKPAADGGYAVIITRGGCLDTSDCFSSTGIAESLQATPVQLFPNPAAATINITVSTPLSHASLQLMDYTGKIMLSQKNLDGSSWNIDISQLNPGIYFLRLAAEGQVFGVQKLCKY